MRAVLASLAGEAAPDAGQTRRSPSVATAPELTVLELLLLVVPDVSEEFLVGVPEPLAIALNLGQRLVVKAHRRQKRRRAIQAVGPHLRAVEDVIENAVGVARRAFANPVELSIDGLLYLGVAGPLRCLCVGCAAHGGVGGTSGVDNAEATVRSPLHNRGFGQQNRSVTIARLNHRLREDALLPVATLHRQGRCGGCFNPARAFRLRAIFCGTAHWCVRRAARLRERFGKNCQWSRERRGCLQKRASIHGMAPP